MTIKLIYRYIKYDVDQLTSRYAKARITDLELQSQADTSGSAVSDADLVRRWAETGVAEAKILLKDFLTNTHNTQEDDSLDRAKKEWLFCFTEEPSDGKSIASLLHWFVVRYALYQWAKMFSPDETSQEEAELKEVKAKLSSAMSESGMPTKPKTAWSEADDEIVINYEA